MVFRRRGIMLKGGLERLKNLERKVIITVVGWGAHRPQSMSLEANGLINQTVDQKSVTANGSLKTWEENVRVKCTSWRKENRDLRGSILLFGQLVEES